MSPGSAWTLPGYELALMVEAFGGVGRRERRRVTLVTGERAPLAAFGSAATAMARAELATAGVALVTDAVADVPGPATVRIAGARTLRCDRVAHLLTLVSAVVIVVAGLAVAARAAAAI